MKAAALALSAAALLPFASNALRAQAGSPFVETTTLTFYWSFTHSYVTNQSTPIPTLPDLAVYDPNTLPSGFETFTDTIRAQPYTGAPAGKFAPAGANQQIIDLLLQRMVRDGRLSRRQLGWRWQLIAVREAPATVRELASNPYRVFLSGQSTSGLGSVSASSYEAYGFGPEPVIDDPVPEDYIDSTPSTPVVTLDTGITITLGQYSGNYTETDWGANNNRVRKATGSVATAFRVDFGALFYDDPLHAQTNPSVLPYNYHLKRHYWEASASGIINYNIRTILPPLTSPNVLPTFVATNSSATATGWFYHQYTEYVASMVNNFPVYSIPNPDPSYGGMGTAPLKVTLSTIQYQKRDRFDLSLPAAPENVFTVTVDDGEVQVSWFDMSSNETGFILERSLAPDGPWEQVVKTEANGSPFSDTQLDLDTVYYYRVYAFNGGGSSAYSDPVGVASTAAKPSNLDAGAISSSQINLRWSDNSTVETGYEVQRRRDSTNTWITLVNDLPADTTTYNDTTASSNTKYHYRVRALHVPYGTSAWSDTDDATTTAPSNNNN